MLMRRRSRDVLYYAFDRLWLDGVDLRPLGLMERKRVLHHLLKTNKPNGVFAADQVPDRVVSTIKRPAHQLAAFRFPGLPGLLFNCVAILCRRPRLYSLSGP
jgi:ATP-dependent DNA ligase